MEDLEPIECPECAQRFDDVYACRIHREKCHDLPKILLKLRDSNDHRTNYPRPILIRLHLEQKVASDALKWWKVLDEIERLTGKAFVHEEDMRSELGAFVVRLSR